MIRNFLRKIKKTLKRHKRIPRPVSGIPDGIRPETLNLICVEHFNSPLQSVSYHHLSAWKAAGAFRLYLKLVNGQERRLVFKNAIYEHDHIPALRDLPVHPGPPEFAVYSSKHPGLTQYLPKVYLAEEVIPNKQYLYLLEDLRPDFHNVRSEDALAETIRLLPGVYEALQDWIAVEQPNYLLPYGKQFAQELSKYSHANLQDYGQNHQSEHLPKILDLWDKIVALYNHDVFFSMHPAGPIHGDPNYTNIYLNQRNPQLIKLVDWEWAGIGLPHADLASLLKGANEDMEKKIISNYSSHAARLDPHDNYCLYLWSVLERSLLDASFLAAQINKSIGESRLQIPRAIERALYRTLTAYQALNSLSLNL